MLICEEKHLRSLGPEDIEDMLSYWNYVFRKFRSSTWRRARRLQRLVDFLLIAV